MKKLAAVSVFGMLFLLTSLPLLRAEESEAAGTGMSGSPAEFTDLEQTLKRGRADRVEQRLSDLEQANRFLSERVKMLEKSVYDLKDKVDRRF